MTTKQATIWGARDMLGRFGFDAERSNTPSAVVLLGLLGLTPGDSWADATGDMHGVTPLMEHARLWGIEWKPNTRETVRRQTLHQVVEAGLCEYNADDPQRPVNSPRANYRVSAAALAVISRWDTPMPRTDLRPTCSISPDKLRPTPPRETWPASR